MYEPHFRLRQQKSQRGFRTLVLVAPVRVQPIAAAAALAGVEFQPQIVPAKEPVEGPLRLSVPPWVGRGTVCFQARRNRGLRLDRLLVEVAQRLLDALTALQPQWAEAWAARANADYLAGDPKATFVDLARALADDPKHLKALADLGAMLEDAGRRDDALRVYQRALEIAPQWRPAREATDRLRAAIAGKDL